MLEPALAQPVRKAGGSLGGGEAQRPASTHSSSTTCDLGLCRGFLKRRLPLSLGSWAGSVRSQSRAWCSTEEINSTPASPSFSPSSLPPFLPSFLPFSLSFPLPPAPSPRYSAAPLQSPSLLLSLIFDVQGIPYRKQSRACEVC